MEFRSGKAEQSKVVHINDTGGQDVFSDVRAMLNAPSGTCHVVVFNLAQAQNPLQQKGVLSDLAERLNSITLHADKAPVLLVGTHKGAVQGGDDGLFEIHRRLHEHLDPHCPAYKDVFRDDALCFFAVENSKGFTGDETIQRLAKAIDLATDSLPVMQRRVPTAWVRVYDELRDRLTSRKQQLLPLAEATSIAAQCGMGHGHGHGLTLEQEVRALLQFLHSIGAVLWFDEPVLRDLVTLDPQWLVDGISCVIRNFEIAAHRKPCDEKCEREQERNWSALKRNAKLHTSLLPLIWGEERFAPYHELLLRMMIRFSFAVPLRGKDELIVPPLFVFTEQKAVEAGGSASLSFFLHFNLQIGAGAGARVDEVRGMGSRPAQAGLPAGRCVPPSVRGGRQLVVQHGSRRGARDLQVARHRVVRPA